jgi:hypothetical protein
MRVPLSQEQKMRLVVWWTVWGAILTWLIFIYVFFARGKPLPVGAPLGDLPVNLAGFVPLFVSVILRWLVLPRSVDPKRAFVLFVVGIALAEACGILGIFLGGPYRDLFFALGLLGVVQYVPFYAKKLFDPKVSGFIPNN